MDQVNMLARFKQDVRRWVKPQEIADPSVITRSLVLKLLWKHLPLQAMLFYRFGVWAKHRKVPGLPGLIQNFIAVVYGLELSVSQDLGGGLYIPHPFGTTISVNKMGENCTVIGSVTVGMRNEWAFPQIGNQVFIGAGARVLGDIVVGDHAVIGANAVVIKDVPTGATVVGIPAKIIHESDKTEMGIKSKDNGTAKSEIFDESLTQ
jgi:serine O-acetyltransferase